jgi:cyanophycinase
MIDPRGGAFTVGLGLVRGLTVFPHFDTAADHQRARTLELRPQDVTLVGVDESTAVVRDRDGSWSAIGDGAVTIFDAASAPEGRRYHNGPVPDLPA